LAVREAADTSLMDALLIVVGAIVGAVSTGGVSAFDAWRQRRVRRRVAARVILGDLYVLEASVEVILEAKRWPDRFDLSSPLDTWRDSREAFAEGVEAWEWALVDGVFSYLHRTAPMVRLGEPCSAQDEDVLAVLLKRIPKARDLVLEHATSKRERDRLVAQLAEAATPQR
jgi:hypothetical protein